MRMNESGSIKVNQSVTIGSKIYFYNQNHR